MLEEQYQPIYIIATEQYYLSDTIVYGDCNELPSINMNMSLGEVTPNIQYSWITPRQNPCNFSGGYNSGIVRDRQ